MTDRFGAIDEGCGVFTPHTKAKAALHCALGAQTSDKPPKTDFAA